MEHVLRRNGESGMRRLAEVAAMVESNIVIVAGNDFFVWRDNQADAYVHSKRADPNGG